MKRSSFAILLPLALTPAVFAACGGGNDNLPPPPPPPIAQPVATQDAAPPPVMPAEDAGPPAPAAPPVTLEPGTASPDPAAPLPTVKITAPAKSALIPTAKAGDTEVKLDVKNWKAAPGDAHVHVILDNKPYFASFDPKQPVKLSQLTGGEPIAEGQHVLVAFPSRANHESVKTAGAIAIVDFWVGAKKGDAKVDPTKQPMLIYSRPKGEYKGDMASRVLVDFQIANVTLAEGKDHVHVSVTGPGIDGEKTAHVEKFGTPLYLTNLHNGSYTVKLDLLSGDNKPVAGPWNSTTRTIVINKDAPADPPHAAHAPAPAADAGAPKK